MNQYFKYANEQEIEIPDNIGDENEFNRVGVELFKEIGILNTTVSSGSKYDAGSQKEVPFSKEEAVIAGSLVRYSKLGVAFIEQYAKGRLETTMIMFRGLAETYVNLKFFLKYADAHTLRHFIKHSLQAEYQVLNILRENTSSKEILEPIEKRIIATMRRAFDDADFDESEMNSSSKWEKKIKARLAEIINPQAYSLIYGMASHAIHGTWQDLVTCHLTKKDGGFYTHPEWSMPRLQVLSVATVLSCDLLESYSKRLLPENNDRQELLVRIAGIMEKASVLDQMHEKFMQNEK